MYTYNMVAVASVVLMAVVCCWATASTDAKVTDNKANTTTSTNDNTKFPDKRQGKYFNYLRLQMVNATTVQRTNVPVIRQIWAAPTGVSCYFRLILLTAMPIQIVVDIR